MSQAPGGSSSFSLGWGSEADNKPTTTSVKVHHTPGGGSSLVLGGDTPAEQKPAEDAKNEQAEGEDQTEATPEQNQEEAKDQSAAQEPAEQSSGVVPGTGETGDGNAYNPHTSVKVHNPPGGKSSITF